MHWFYVKESQISNDTITITGQDVNHIRQVLRMKEGERVVICDGAGVDYYCTLASICEDKVIARIEQMNTSESELPVRIVLYQGLPKLDKMELIIQKAVELGVHEIVPVQTKRAVVRLDEKKGEKKLARWQVIAEAAAKQSGRGMIPIISPVMDFSKAVEDASKEGMLSVIPYELAKGMQSTQAFLNQVCQLYHSSKKKAASGTQNSSGCVQTPDSFSMMSLPEGVPSIGIMIGPEGGFEEKEVERALNAGIQPISLGKRILRTETASLALLSAIMIQIEIDGEND